MREERKAGHQLWVSFQPPNLTFLSSFLKNAQLWKPGELSNTGRSSGWWNRPSNPVCNLYKVKEASGAPGSRAVLSRGSTPRCESVPVPLCHRLPLHGGVVGWLLLQDAAVIWITSHFFCQEVPRAWVFTSTLLPLFELHSISMGWELEVSKNNCRLYPAPALVGLFQELWFAPFLCLGYFHFKALYP